MDINVSIIDQRVGRLADELAGEFAERLKLKNDKVRLRSAAFVYLMVKTVLDLSSDEALDAMTERGSDFGVDAMEVSDVQDGEFTVTLFRGNTIIPGWRETGTFRSPGLPRPCKPCGPSLIQARRSARIACCEQSLPKSAH